MENAAAAAAVIIGFVNGIQLAFEPDRRGFYYFLAALGAGVALGALHYYGLTIELGILAAIGSSGVYKVAKKVGGQN